MSTANKLTYLNVTKQKLKQAINNIGGEVTDETTFRQYVNQLENAYDRLPKTEFEEGESVTLENTLKGKLDFDDGKVGFGKTSQETTTGKNKFEPALYVGTQGITQSRCNVLIDDDEFVMNCTGQDMYFGEVTATGSSYFAGKGVKINVEGQTSLYLYLTNQTFFSNYITAFDSNNVSLGFRQVASYKGAYSIPEGTSYVTLRFGRANAVSGETYRTKVMVVFGDTEDTDYERYSGGYVSPSTNWSQTVKCVAGKNIVESKSIGGSGGYTDALYCEGDLEPLTTYAISFEGTVGNKLYTNENLFDLRYFEVQSGRMSIVARTKASISKKNATQHKANGWIIFKNQGGGNTNENVFNDLQIEKNIVATSYLPYNTIEEVVSGKNYFDVEKETETNVGVQVTYNKNTIKLNGTTSEAGNIYGNNGIDISNSIIVATLDKGTYTIGTNMKSGSLAFTNGGSIGFYYRQGTQTLSSGAKSNSTLSEVIKTTITINETSDIAIQLFTNKNGVKFEDLLLEFSIEKGEVTTLDYEAKYITPTSYQLSLGDKEFNGIGDYKDELIYDVDEDKVYKNEKIGKVVLTGSENWEGGEVETGIYRYQITLADAINIASRQNALTEYTHFSLTGEVGTGFIYSKIFYFYPDRDKTNATLFKAWLTEHNTPLLYPLATPVEIPITDQTLINQVKALYNAHSNNGTTIITSNGDLPMIIKVRGLKGE